MIIPFCFDPNQKFRSDGKTALMFASKNGHLEIAKLLIENGAYLNAADRSGQTATSYALRNDKLETAIFLLEHGAKTDKKLSPDMLDLLEDRVNQISEIQNVIDSLIFPDEDPNVAAIITEFASGANSSSFSRVDNLMKWRNQ